MASSMSWLEAQHSQGLIRPLSSDPNVNRQSAIRINALAEWPHARDKGLTPEDRPVLVYIECEDDEAISQFMSTDYEAAAKNPDLLTMIYTTLTGQKARKVIDRTSVREVIQSSETTIPVLLHIKSERESVVIYIPREERAMFGSRSAREDWYQMTGTLDKTHLKPRQGTGNLCCNCSAFLPKMVCVRCRKAGYCNKACQKADWPAHKLNCGR